MHKKDNHHRLHIYESLIAGIGAFIGLSFIGLIAQSAQTMMLIAPFGASAVLLFSAPNAPFSQPWNIFNGYIISTILGSLVLVYTDGGWLSIGIGLGLTIMLMQWLRVIHPPAGANFLIVTQGHLTFYLLAPLFIGLITLVVVAMSVEQLRRKFLHDQS